MFNEKTFASVFKAWFADFGEIELKKKYKPESDLWFIYHDYAAKEIARDGSNFSTFRDVFSKRVKSVESTKKTAIFLINN